MTIFKVITNFHMPATVRQNKEVPFTMVLVLAERPMGSSSINIHNPSAGTWLSHCPVTGTSGVQTIPHSFPGASHWFQSQARTLSFFVIFPHITSESGSDALTLQVFLLGRCSEKGLFSPHRPAMSGLGRLPLGFLAQAASALASTFGLIWRTFF